MMDRRLGANCKDAGGFDFGGNGDVASGGKSGKKGAGAIIAITTIVQYSTVEYNTRAYYVIYSYAVRCTVQTQYCTLYLYIKRGQEVTCLLTT